MRTLVVDDGTDVRLMLERALRKRGHDVICAADAETAWDLCHADWPPLIVLDWMLPGMDGLELSRRIRAMPQGDVPLILLVTGNDQPSDLQAALDAGVNDYLAKPFRPALLDVRLAVAERRAAEIAARKRAEETLERLARTDELTGLANRRAGLEGLALLLRHGARLGVPVAAAIADLDRFKLVNDSFGHAAGDVVLRTTARLLQDAFRGQDVVARWGGEEFVVALLAARAQDLVERLDGVRTRLQAEEIPLPDGQTTRITLSAGVAEYAPGSQITHEKLLMQADEALYAAKEQGRNRVCRALPSENGPTA